MSITITSLTKKELFAYNITPFDQRPTESAKRWPSEPLIGKLTAYMIDDFTYRGEKSSTTYLQIDGKWYKTTSAHVRFLIASAHDAFGPELIDELTSVKLYKIPTERGEAAELEFNLR